MCSTAELSAQRGRETKSPRSQFKPSFQLPLVGRFRQKWRPGFLSILDIIECGRRTGSRAAGATSWRIAFPVSMQLFPIWRVVLLGTIYRFMTTEAAIPIKLAGMNVTAGFSIPTCHVGGHSLIRRGREWIDSAIHSMPQAPRVYVHINSHEYFELLQRFPKLPSLLAIGDHLHLVLGGTVYEIYQ
jgi:hypothetical protein